jgi:hypothetical protein
MTRAGIAGACVALFGLSAAAGACSSSSRPAAEAPPELRVDSGSPEGGGVPEGGEVDSAGGGSHPDGSAMRDAFADAADSMAGLRGDADLVGDADDAGEAGAAFTGPPPPAAACGQTGAWGAGVVAVSTAADDILDAVTSDELSIAWTSGAGSTQAVLYADRASSADAFAAPQSLPAGQFTADRVALSPDGLRLTVVNADGRGFSELTRTSRALPAAAFGSAGTGAYSNLDAAGALSAGQLYGDPVLSADDTVFYYSVYAAGGADAGQGGADAGQTATIYRSERLLSTDTWPVGFAVANSPDLAAQGTLRRRPTAVSADRRTLFFWDEISGTERALWADESTGAFDMLVDLGDRSMAAPNAACTHLYYSAPGASSIDIFVASFQ